MWRSSINKYFWFYFHSKLYELRTIDTPLEFSTKVYQNKSQRRLVANDASSIQPRHDDARNKHGTFSLDDSCVNAR